MYTVQDILNVLDKDPNTVTYYTFFQRFQKGQLSRVQFQNLVNRQYVLKAFEKYAQKPLEMIKAFDDFVKHPNAGFLNELKTAKPQTKQTVETKQEKLVENVIELRNIFTGAKTEIRLV